jgi:hypothetical protein
MESARTAGLSKMHTAIAHMHRIAHAAVTSLVKWSRDHRAPFLQADGTRQGMDMAAGAAVAGSGALDDRCVFGFSIVKTGALLQCAMIR